MYVDRGKATYSGKSVLGVLMELTELIQSIDIVEFISQYVELVPKNDEFWGLSPFKEEKTPSFSVRREIGQWYDFSSGQGGNVFHFVQRYFKCSSYDAVEILKKYAGYDGEVVVPEKKLASTMIFKRFLEKKQASKQSSGVTLPDSCMEKYEKDDSKLEIWESEGISRASLDKFQVFYDPFSNRPV